MAELLSAREAYVRGGRDYDVALAKADKAVEAGTITAAERREYFLRVFFATGESRIAQHELERTRTTLRHDFEEAS